MSRFFMDQILGHLSYTTEPLSGDTEVMGPIALYLHAAIATNDANFIVKVKYVSPNGTEFVLSGGWLKASHRELDKGRSKPWQSYPRHTKATPIAHGEINGYVTDIPPIVSLAKKVHKTRVEIWSCEYPSEPLD